MAQKIHPKSFRLGINEDWSSKWLPEKMKKFSLILPEDILIRDYVKKKFKNAGVSSVEIERTSEKDILVSIFTQRPGLIIGRQGKGIEQLKEEVDNLIKNYRQEKGITAPYSLRIEIQEIPRGEIKAAIVAREIAFQLEKRIPFRRVIKRALSNVMGYKSVAGAKIQVAGRLDGTEIARKEFVKAGRLPLQTIRAKIDYAFDEAICSYGKIGIKVWIYKEEKEEK